MQPQDPYGPPSPYASRPQQQPYPPVPQPPQPYAPGPPAGPSPDDPARYDFFMNPTPPARRSVLPTGSFGMKIGLILGGAVLLMIIMGVIISLLPSNLNSKELTALAQSQNGLFAICNDALNNAKAQDTKNFASNCSISLATEQTDLLAYTAKHGLKLGKKQLDLGVNTKNMSALKASIAASTYDETFTALVQSQLTLYTAKIKTTFKTAKSAQQKQQLRTEYTTAQLLNIQLKGTAAAGI